MKLVCLVKQIPRPDSIEFDPDTKALRREGVPLLHDDADFDRIADVSELQVA